MSRTRYEWTLLDFAIWTAGAVTVPIYETSSAEQVQWILADSGAMAVVRRDRRRTRRPSRECATGCPTSRDVWQIDERRARTSSAAAGTEVVRRRRSSARAGRARRATTSRRSSTPPAPPAAPRAACSPTATSSPSARNAVERLADAVLHRGRLDAAVPAAGARLRPADPGAAASRPGTILGHTAGHQEPRSTTSPSFRPTFLLAVPRVFEKVYNAAEQKAAADGKGKIFDAAADTAIAYSRGARRRRARARPAGCKHAVFDQLVYGKLRAALGGRVPRAISGGAPLGERLGHFFRGIGFTSSRATA